MEKKLFSLMLFFCVSFTFAQANFTGAINNNWNTPANWSTGLVPDSNTDVTIPSSATVNITTNVAVKSITVTGDPSFTDNVVLDANLTLTAVSYLGRFRWLSGAISGTAPISAGSTTHIVGNGTKYVSAGTTLNLYVTYCEGSGTLYLTDCTLNVLELVISNNFSISPYSSSTELLTTTNWITMSGANSTASITCRLNSNGTVGASAGTLNINSPDAHFTPSSSLSTFGTLGSGILNFSGNLTFSGTFPNNLTTPINMSGTINIPDTATFSQYGAGMAGINWTGGTLTGGGTLNIANNAQFNLVGNDVKVIGGNTTLNNNGTVNITDAGLIYLNDSTFNNLATGNVIHTGTQIFTTSGSNSELFNNAGTINRLISSGTAQITCRFNNSGTINVNVGTLNISSQNNTLGGGQFNVANGAALKFSGSLVCSGNLTGAANGLLEFGGQVSVPATTSFNINGSTGMTWNGINLKGGGTANNTGLITLSGDQNYSISEQTTLNNSGTINQSNGVLSLNSSTLHNLSAGMINLTPNTFITTSLTLPMELFNNEGTINRNTGTGTMQITCNFTNSGTINANSGTLVINNPNDHFNGGNYNVMVDATLIFRGKIVCAQSLSGQIDGNLSLDGILTIPTSASFDFTGSTIPDWISGSIDGGGTLTNNSDLRLANGGEKALSGGTTLANNGNILLNAGLWYITEATVNNLAGGVIDFTADNANVTYGTSTVHNLNNYGLIKKSGGAGTAMLSLIVNNYGTIDIETGTLQLLTTLNNTLSGTVTGNGTIQLPTDANFTNSGTFAPGGNPGKLSGTGNYKSNADARLAVELYGLTPVSQYDRLDISGNGIFDGSVQVTLYFAPSINDEFVIAKTVGTITQFNMESPVTATFGNMQYSFDVTMRNNNEVVLTNTDATLGTQNLSFQNGLTVSPNPARDFITISNQSGIELSGADIVDLNGRIVRHVPLERQNDKISTVDLASGIYLLRIHSDSASAVKKFIKE